MNIEAVKEYWIWCLALTYSLLMIWFLMFWRWHDGLYRLHSRWFKIDEVRFDAIHYGLMGIYKIGIFLFNLTPLVAVCLMKS